jgi:hypothetical protein
MIRKSELKYMNLVITKKRKESEKLFKIIEEILDAHSNHQILNILIYLIIIKILSV